MAVCSFLTVFEGTEFACAKPVAPGASTFGVPHSSLGPKEMTMSDVGRIFGVSVEPSCYH